MAETDELRAYLDQLLPPTPAGYGADPSAAFDAGFYWALDAISDYLDGQPWVGGKPWVTHGADGKPLASPLPPVTA